QLERVDHGPQHHHRGAVLVVVEHGDVEIALQTLLDLEAARRRDVLEVDAAEDRGQRLHDHHDLVDVLGGQADGERVDAGEFLEDERLALHDRLSGAGADVAEAEHGRAVGDDGDRVLLDRERVGLLGVVMDGHTDARHARRVRHRQVVARLHRHLALHLDLAAEVHEEGAVGDVDDADAFQRFQTLDHLLAVTLAARLERDVAGDGVAAHLDEVDGADVRPALPDGGGDLAEHAGLVLDLESHRQTVTGRRSVDHAASPVWDRKWAVFYSRRLEEVGKLIAGEQAKLKLAAVGVDGDTVAAEERVPEDAVEAGTGVVEHHRSVADLEVADPERGGGGGGADGTAAERVQLDRRPPGGASDPDLGGEPRGDHGDA